MNKRFNSRKMARLIDSVHIAAGVLIVILAAFAFLNSEKYRFLFPVIFLSAAALNCFNGVVTMIESGRDAKKKVKGVGILVLSLLLLMLGVVSAITIWR